MKKKINVVTIGGGGGQSMLLSALKNYISDINISAIVSVFDSGGSTGKLRDEYGVLATGDIYKCIIALSNNEEVNNFIKKRFNSNSRINGHSIGNIILTFLTKHLGDFSLAVKELQKILEVEGNVMPVSLDKATLACELEDSTFIYGETNIDKRKQKTNTRIKRLFLVPHASEEVRAYQESLKAIRESEFIVIGPGSLYTSIMCNLLVADIKREIKKSKSKLVQIVNAKNDDFETKGFEAVDYINISEEYLGRKIDILISSGRFFENNKYQIYHNDVLDPEGFHDKQKLVKLLMSVFYEK